MLTALQLVEPCRDADEAREVLSGLTAQVDYLGGRVLPPSPVTPAWRVQAFFLDVPETPTDLLPEGFRRVVVPDGQRSRLGLRAEAVTL